MALECGHRRAVAVAAQLGVGVIEAWQFELGGERHRAEHNDPCRNSRTRAEPTAWRATASGWSRKGCGCLPRRRSGRGQSQLDNKSVTSRQLLARARSREWCPRRPGSAPAEHKRKRRPCMARKRVFLLLVAALAIAGASVAVAQASTGGRSHRHDGDQGSRKGGGSGTRHADQAPRRDLPGERLVRPLLRHLSQRGQPDGRAAVPCRAGHADGERAVGGAADEQPQQRQSAAA